MFHTGVRRISVGSSRSHISVSLSLYLSSCPDCFWKKLAQPVITCSTCVRRPRVPQYNIYTSALSSHRGPKDPSEVLLRLYVHIYVSLSGCPCWFLAIVCAVLHCAQRISPHTLGSNPLSDSILFPSNFLFVFISSVRVQSRDAFIIPENGVWRTPVGSSPANMHFHMSLFRLVLVNFWRLFTWTVIVRSTCSCRPRVQTPWSTV